MRPSSEAPASLVGLQPSRLRLAAGWGSLGRESGIGAAQASPTLNQVQHKSWQHHHWHPSSPVATGEQRSSRCGIHWEL